MERYEVAIIGGGPGGYVAAIRCAQLGLHTALIEREHLGGTCLNWGCIPTKALLRSAEVVSWLQRGQEWGITCDHLQVDYSAAVRRSRRIVDRLVKGVGALLKKNQVEVIEGTGTLVGPREVEVQPAGIHLAAENVILATGGRPRSIPGVEIDREKVITSREALRLEEVPESLAIIGAGAVGVEFADIFQTFGSQVTLIEMLPHLLPAGDPEISEELQRSFRRRKIKMLTGAQVEGLTEEAANLKVTVSGPQGPEEVRADRVLVAVGVAANTEKLGLEKAGVTTDHGFIPVDSRMATKVPGVYAIGDVTGPPLLAHVASHQGLIAADTIAGREVEPFTPEEVPYATYCHPQVASVGWTEEQAREQGYNVQVGRFPFRGSGKAVAGGDYEGLVKLVFDGTTGELLGGHLIGPEVTELVQELVVAKKLKATRSDLAGAIHAHPTLSEALMEAAWAASGEAIHI